MWMSGVHILPAATWSGPMDTSERWRAVAALETGKILLFPHLNFALEARELDLVQAAMREADAGKGAKNVSYDPATGACKAGPLGEETAAALAAPLGRFANLATGLILGLAPNYARGLQPGRTSFRPTEVEGREQSWRKDDRRLHVDAFPSTPVAGRRILRVFSNVDPLGRPRRWLVGEPFEAHARRFLSKLPRPSRAKALIRARLGLTRGAQTAYDQLMLGLHDASKRDAAYQADSGAETYDFPAGGTWIVYTDQTPHAALTGCCAFEQTFYLRPEVLADPTSAPLAVLERLTGRTLVPSTPAAARPQTA
jgi:hypothetical protein